MSKIQEQAAQWFLRMQNAEPNHPERSRFEAWLMMNPAHAAAYAAQIKLWNHFEKVSDIDALADVLGRQRDASRQSRRHFLKQGGIGLLFTGVAGGSLYRHWQNHAVWEVTFETAIGQTSRQSLQDGSTVTLGADTATQATFSRAERSVQLTRGEVIFDVARDAERPFVIDSGFVRITVLGTRFVVTRLSDKVRVSVEHGRVQLVSGPFWKRQVLVLEDGQVAEIDALDDGAAQLRRIARPAADAFAFERGLIVFDGASLAEIAETLSRYREKPIRAAAGAENVPPFDAVAHLSNIDGFLGSLPKIYPVTLSEELGQTLLSTRR